MKATVGFMDASVEPQRFDIRSETVVEIGSETSLLRFIEISTDLKIFLGFGQ
jgi:hypothetical protein